MPVAHAGSITGHIHFGGLPPKLPPLNISSVPDCARHHLNGIADESVVIDAGGGLKNVVVYLKDMPPSDGSAREPAVLDQVNCQYVPHVAAVQVGQTLTIKSSDPMLHNVHAIDSNPSFNWAFNGVGRRNATFMSAGFFTMRCDVHPWMKAIVCVFDHPYFAVTDDAGRFTIANVPPSRYTLVARHERYGELEQQIEIPADGSSTVNFVYR
jgi:plastocyanin